VGLEESAFNNTCKTNFVSRGEVKKVVCSEAVLSHVRSKCSVLACVCVA